MKCLAVVAIVACVGIANGYHAETTTEGAVYQRKTSCYQGCTSNDYMTQEHCEKSYGTNGYRIAKVRSSFCTTLKGTVTLANSQVESIYLYSWDKSDARSENECKANNKGDMPPDENGDQVTVHEAICCKGSKCNAPEGESSGMMEMILMLFVMMIVCCFCLFMCGVLVG